MVYLFLADGFEEIEALTVVDVLRRAGIEISTVSINESLYVQGRSQIIVKADLPLKQVNKDKVDMVVLPGGMPGTTNLEKNESIQDILKYCIDNEKWVSAICAAPSIIGKKGYLKGQSAICYPGFEKYLEGADIASENVVLSGKYITSKGPGTALDFSYKIVEVLKGKDLAEKLKSDMQYCF